MMNTSYSAAARAGLMLFSLLMGCSYLDAQTTTISSPNRGIEVVVEMNGSDLRYHVNYRGEEVIHHSKLGLVLAGADLSTGLRWKSASAASVVNDKYELFTGKKKMVTYKANRKNISVIGKSGVQLDVIFQVSDDGFAFCYKVMAGKTDSIRVNSEATSFSLDGKATGFLQPMQVAKTGFEQTNPAYEDNYQQGITAGTASPSNAGWAYPALFQTGGDWILLTEAGLNRNYCATRLLNEQGDPVYHVGFPDPREVITPDGLLPRSTGSLTTPWRVVVIGNLSTIVSSTLGTDVAAPAIKMDLSVVKPGIASWSWIMSKDDSIVYSEQKRYVDFASKMNWKYCLIDANWDRNIGYEKIAELAAYAATKKVGILLWYNSAGDWNTVKMTPKDKMITHESRVVEFARIKAMGIKGVKIDFFGGDGRSVINYYIDILEDAAKAGILVNFHGATLPRGWSRTYPHLVTAEAVKGFEMITFNQRDADLEANHSTMLPFTRNVFDPMDFTSMNLYKIGSRVQRKTTSAFELATSVVFLSGIQHYAESPAGMTDVPVKVQDYLRNVPVRWDEVRFIDGFPGRFIVIARRAGTRWYIAGMNGTSAAMDATIDPAMFGAKKITLYTDGDEPLSFDVKSIGATGPVTLKMEAAGGFVMVADQVK